MSDFAFDSYAVRETGVISVDGDRETKEAYINDANVMVNIASTHGKNDRL